MYYIYIYVLYIYICIIYICIIHIYIYIYIQYTYIKIKSPCYFDPLFPATFIVHHELPRQALGSSEPALRCWGAGKAGEAPDGVEYVEALVESVESVAFLWGDHNRPQQLDAGWFRIIL